MEKQRKLSETSRRMITPEIQENNFTKHLENTTEIRKIKELLKFMRNNFIPKIEVDYIDVDDYINFYELIPSKLWSKKPVFYFKNGVFDALGMLGESVHHYNIYSKTLEMYFKDCVGIKITDAMDGRDDSFNDIKDSKERFLNYLNYIKQNTEIKELKMAYAKSRKIIHGRYY